MINHCHYYFVPLKGYYMKTIYFENIRNRERFYCKDIKNVQLIDGIEYIRVFRMGTQRDCLVKKESLKKIPEPK